MLRKILNHLRKKPTQQHQARGPFYLTKNGFFNAPYYIFLRAAGQLTDPDVLHLLDADQFQRSTEFRRVGERRRCICLAEDSSWIHIIDDWRCTLWERGPTLVDHLRASLPVTDIFTCSVGESDGSFAFALYTAGKLARQYIVDDPNYRRHERVVREDFGSPLRGEKPLAVLTNEKVDELDYVLSLAATLGIKTQHDIDAIRCYCVP